MALSVGQITIVDVNDGSFIVEKYASNTSYTIAPSSGWSNNIPEPIEGQFVWKKQRREYANGSTSNWSEPIRITGIPGNPGKDGEPGVDGKQGQLGLFSSGATLYLKGFDLSGTLTATIGYLFIGNTRYTVNEYSQELTNDGQGYVIFDGVNVIFAKMISNSSGSNWVTYNDSTIINSAFWVIGTFYKNGNSISELEIIQPQSRDNYEKSNFMNILASGDIDNINTWATANGIASVFEKIAVLEAFINKMFANEIELNNGGFIQSIGFETGSAKGFKLDSTGRFEGRKINVEGGAFEQITISGNGIFEGDISNKLLKLQEGTSGSTVSFSNKIYWDSYDFYVALSAVAEIPFTSEFDKNNLGQYKGSSSSAIGSFNGKEITNIIKLIGSPDSLIKLWFGDGTCDYIYVVMYHGFSYYDIDFNFSSPNSINRPSIATLCTVDNIVEYVSNLKYGTPILADGWIIKDGVSKEISYIIVYEDSFKLGYNDGTKSFSFKKSSLKTKSNGSFINSTLYNISGTIIIKENPDLFEVSSITPKSDETDIGTMQQPFRFGSFKTLTTEVLNLPNYCIKGVASVGMYCILPNGLIIQWNQESMHANSTATMTLPITFPGGNAISLADSMEKDYNIQPAQVYYKDKSKIKIVNGSGYSQAIQWIAIGY
ncbi:MAG: hypothetical protein PQJ49_10535 [Sphaerochaetaceae bacterium]|nr:hypothetical protein [Sphaerochaetaceae bacterium]